MKFTELYGGAKFVTAGDKSINTQMRGTFNIENENGKTEIIICGLGYFEFKINGKKVTEDLFTPAASHYNHSDICFCYDKFGEELSFRIYSMKYDITPYIVKGENVISCELGLGWYKNIHGENNSMSYGDLKLCYKITNGEKEIYSDDKIKWREGPVTDSSFTEYEHQDYTKADYADGWENIGYDDSAWEYTKIAETPDSNYYIQDCPSDRVIKSVYPRLISETNEWKFYDLGECVTGWPIIKCTEKGARVRVRMAEWIKDNKLDERFWHGQVYEFTADGNEREYHPKFMLHAFNSIEVPKNAELIRIDVIHTDINLSSEFICDNDTLNWFNEAFIRTQLINTHGCIPSDCPHLEKRGYTGDGQATAETVMAMFDAKAMYKKWIEDIADSQDKISGHVQYTAPYIQSGGGPGGWGCAIIEVPYAYYKIYGDKEPLYKYFDNMRHYFYYLESHSENDLIVSDQPGQWCLGEWCAPSIEHATLPLIPPPLVNNYFYIKSLYRMIEIAKVTGKEEYIEGFKKIIEIKSNALIREYFDEKTGDFAENKNSANVFMLDIGLGDERTLNNLVYSLIKRGTFNTGIFGTDILVRFLFEKGLGSIAVDLLTVDKAPSFKYMMDNGATTLWEEWLGHRSLCHPMFGAVARYFYYYLLGIRQRNKTYGYEDVIIAPAFLEKIRNVSGKLNTPYGEIKVNIDRKHKYTIDITIPEGMNATYIDELGKEYKLSKGKSSFALRKDPEMYVRYLKYKVSFADTYDI
ncbi:MAG: hypothetical protein E7564_05920 [Ruminococcaceae bacterium]|nr:hypothetical protein [Oscillospiraceae bacterium]